MSTKPRIPDYLVQGFTMMSEGGDSPAAKIAIPVELTRLAAIPIASDGSLQLNPVVHECIRLYNANYQGCEYCQNARAAGAVQEGLDEELVSKLTRFETSDLPDHIKAALRIANAVSSGPQTLTQQIWDDARRFYSEREMVDLVLLSVHTTSSKVTITLGLDPGKESSSRIFYPSEDVYGSSPALKRAVEEMEKRGLATRPTPEIDYKIKVTDTRAK